MISNNSSNASKLSTKSSSDEDIKSTEQDKTISRDTGTHQNDSTFGRNSPTEELFPGEEFESAIVMGNDMTPGGDETMNGFSAKGWNPHLATASIRQAVKTLEATGSFVEELILTRKNSAASTSQACDQLRDILIIDNIEIGQCEHERYIVTITGYNGALFRRIGFLVCSEPQGSIHHIIMERLESLNTSRMSMIVRGASPSIAIVMFKAGIMTRLSKLAIPRGMIKACGQLKGARCFGLWQTRGLQ